ncbi:MAG TPA: vitamin K epoxide reductase family protein [Abditibacteriaceae bacterium]|jgi:uncharacterized membrane protein
MQELAPTENKSNPWHFSWPHIALSFVGLWLSYDAWQAHQRVKSGEDSGCEVTATINCDKVLTSQYAEVFGIPLGIYGLVYFLVVLLTSVSSEANFSWRRFRLTQFAVASVGILSSLALTYISKVLLDTFCKICLRVHATTTALFIVSLVLLIWAIKQEKKRSPGN